MCWLWGAQLWVGEVDILMRMDSHLVIWLVVLGGIYGDVR